MAISVTYRRHPQTKKWNIRFRSAGKKELVESYVGTISEEIIARKVQYYKEKIDLGRLDPWEEKIKKEKEKRLSFRLSDAIDLYIRDGKSSGRWKIDSEGKCTTAEHNETRLSYLLGHIGDVPVEVIKKDTILNFLNNYKGTTKPLSAYSKKSYLSTINTFLKWLYDNNYKTDLVKTKLPKATKDRAVEIEKQVRGITFYELKKLCVGLRLRDKQLQEGKYVGHYVSRNWAIHALLFTFALMLRREEINKIYPDDITRDLRLINIGNMEESFRAEFIPKGGIKTIPTTRLMRKVLSGMEIHKMPPHEPIIKRTNDQVYRKLKEAARLVYHENNNMSLQIIPRNVRLHDLRHGGIMYYRSKGWPDSLISQLARHASSEVTSKIYGGVDPVQLRRTLYQFDK